MAGSFVASVLLLATSALDGGLWLQRGWELLTSPPSPVLALGATALVAATVVGATRRPPSPALPAPAGSLPPEVGGSSSAARGDAAAERAILAVETPGGGE